tara:strand:+ start:761 stop:1195 length:435 start_codon:yes stop_codon:yes gene_type:complete
MKTVTIQQPFYLKYVSALKKLTKKLSRIKTEQKIQRDQDLWYGLEQSGDKPFRWSHPITKLNIQNVDKVVFVFSDPIGREISFKTKEVDYTIKLDPGEEYKVIVSTYDADEITIRIDPFNPDSDTRSLGAQYYSITSEDTLVLN